MLPDLRVLILATVATFLATTGAGLLASVRLMPEPLATMQAERETPVIRVALSWQDLNQPVTRPEPVSASLGSDRIEPAPAKINAAPAKSEDRPATAPAESKATAPADKPAIPGESIAMKSATDPSGDNPATTGAITQNPKTQDGTASFAESPERARFAARSDPAEVTSHVPPAVPVATPARAEPKKAKHAPQPRRSRIVRRIDSTQGTPAGTATSDGTASFFIDFGSRMNR
jgi:hypothetical protein